MFDTDFVDVAFEDSRNAVWKFGGRNVSGLEFVDEVVDRNYAQRNRWSFLVRVPNSSKIYTGVQPTVVPNRKIWAGLERRSLQFGRANIGKYRNKKYGKLAISDVHEAKTRVILNNANSLPRWLKAFKPITKRKVARTKANDGGSLVSVFDSENHRKMIRFFLALKPWILDDGYSPGESHRATKARRAWTRAIKKRGSLRGLNVVVTGFLTPGTRPKVDRWLKSLGANPQSYVNEETNVLILGPHYLGNDRNKIRAAKKLDVNRMTEAQFHRKYLS